MTMQSPSLAPAEPRATLAARCLPGLLAALLLAVGAGLAPALAQDPAAQAPGQAADAAAGQADTPADPYPATLQYDDPAALETPAPGAAPQGDLTSAPSQLEQGAHAEIGRAHV